MLNQSFFIAPITWDTMQTTLDIIKMQDLCPDWHHFYFLSETKTNIYIYMFGVSIFIFQITLLLEKIKVRNSYFHYIEK